MNAHIKRASLEYLQYLVAMIEEGEVIISQFDVKILNTLPDDPGAPVPSKPSPTAQNETTYTIEMTVRPLSHVKRDELESGETGSELALIGESALMCHAGR